MCTLSLQNNSPPLETIQKPGLFGVKFIYIPVFPTVLLCGSAIVFLPVFLPVLLADLVGVLSDRKRFHDSGGYVVIFPSCYARVDA